MTVIGSASIQISPETSGFARGLTKQLAGAGAALVGAIGVTKVVKSIGTIGIAFQDTLNTFSALGPSFASQIDVVSKKSKELGNDLSLPATSAADAAGAMLELAKGGLSAAQAMDAAKGTLQLASAAQIDGAQAAEIQSNALNQFGLSADKAGHVADLLANTANAASGEVTDMAVALKYVGPVAKSFGVSIEDTSTAIGLLANSGIKADQAGTSLRGILASLSSPSKKAAGAIKELGINAFDSQGRFVGLKPLIEQLATAQGKLTTEQFNGAAAMAFGREPLAALTSLASAGGPAFDKMADAVTRVGGAAEVGAAKSKGLGGAFRGLQSQLETTEIDLFDRAAPGIERFVRAVSDKLPGAANAVLDFADRSITALGRFADAVQRGFHGVPADGGAFTQAAVAIGGAARTAFETIQRDGPKAVEVVRQLVDQGLHLVDAAGGFQSVAASAGALFAAFKVSSLITSIAPLASTLLSVGSAFAGAGAAGGGFSAALAVIGGPVTLVVAGIAALGAGLTFLYLRFEPFRNVVNAFAGAFTGTLLPGLKLVAGVFLTAIGPALDYVRNAFRDNEPQLRAAATAFGKVAGVVVTVGAALVAANLGLIFSGIALGLGTAIKAISLFIDGINKILPPVERFAAGAIEKIGGFVSFFLGAFGKVVGALSKVAGAFGLDSLQKKLEGAQRAVEAMNTGLKRNVDSAATTLRVASLRLGTGLSEGVITGIEGRRAAVIASARKLGAGAISGVQTAADRGKLVAVGIGIGDGLADGIRARQAKVIAAARALGAAAIGGVQHAAEVNSPSAATIRIGGFIVQGLALGMDRSQSAVRSAAALGSSVLTSLKNALPDPVALGVSAGDLAAAAARASATAIDKALADRDTAVTSRGPAATASATAAAAATAASAAAAVLKGKSDKAAAALAKLNEQLKQARAAAADAARGGLAHARALEDEAARARDAAQAMPAHTKAQKAARDAALAHADALEQEARAASRSKQATADADAGEVASLIKQRDAAAAAAKAAKDAADKAKSAAKDKVAAAKDAADALLKINQDLATAQAALADAVVAAQAEAAQKARDAAVADGQSMLDIYSGQVDALVARAQALTGAFRDSVLAGAGLGDVFSTVRDGLSKATDDAQSASTSAASAVAAAQDKLTAATTKYNEALAKQQAELAALEEQERQQRQTLAAATLTREEAERRLAAARAVATDGAAASAFELEDLKGAYAEYIAAQKAEQDAQGGVNDAAAKTSEKRAEQLSELGDLAQAQQDLAAAQVAATTAANDLAAAQANAGTVIAGVVDQLKDNLASAQAFAAQIGTLAGLGLNDNLLTQIAALGPKAGGALAAGIIAAGPPTVTEINNLTDSIGVVANTGLDTVAQSLFGKGADVLAQLIEGIRSRFPELDDAVAQINAKLGQIAAGERAVADAQNAAAASQAAAKYGGGGPVGSNLTLKVTNGDTIINGSGLSQNELQGALQQANAQKNADLLQLIKQGVRQ